MPQKLPQTAQETVKLRGGPTRQGDPNKGSEDPNETFCLDPQWFDPANVAYGRWLMDEHWRYLRARA